MTGRIDFDAVRAGVSLIALIGSSVKLNRAGQELVGCCPFHPDRSPSFYVYDGGQRWKCFGCGRGGDVVDYYREATGCTVKEAIKQLPAQSIPMIRRAASAQGKPVPDRSGEARAIWERALPADKTPVETYLRGRAILPPFPPSIRFLHLPCGKGGQSWPCLVAAVSAIDMRVIGIQRIFLNEAGTGKAPVAKPKLSLGTVSGGAIRLGPVASEIVVCEGPEDGLSLRQMTGLSVWVAAGASMLPAMRFPSSVKNVVIAADNDSAGELAAQKATEAFTSRGVSVRIIRPANGCKDFNDELMLAHERSLQSPGVAS